VTESSFQDNSHTGEQAVDGDSLTYWRTRKAVGKNKPTSEWIEIDLENVYSIDQVVMRWNSFFARSYSIHISEDNVTWVTVFQTDLGDGGEDAITFSGINARYIRFESTAWSSTAFRCWLNEFEVYGTPNEGLLDSIIIWVNQIFLSLTN
jgi:hypothetical protein